ncbi:hypothetical protein ACIA5D_32320 [Actinoplanes sp. NPDC051513]|uniref:hypothetical protein n=1 Tax=Actinoplanes sp. NPDC051513 TaxID=3363908 RepID=UPI0037BCC8B9
MGQELLYRSERTQVSRQTAPDGDGAVVCKRALGPAPHRGSIFVLTLPLSPHDGPHQSTLHAAATAPG